MVITRFIFNYQMPIYLEQRKAFDNTLSDVSGLIVATQKPRYLEHCTSRS